MVQQIRGTAIPVNAALVLVAGGLLGQIYSDVQLGQVTGVPVDAETDVDHHSAVAPGRAHLPKEGVALPRYRQMALVRIGYCVAILLNKGR